MSAICGIVHFDGRPVERSDLETMAQSSPWRGPDGVSFHLDGNAGFVHLALHVTPESAGEVQPVVSENGRHLLLADVRLDNRGELEGKLGLEPARMNSLLQGAPDSVYLMESFLRWGEDCVDHLLGDFVFAVWDRQERSLFLARDSLGAFSVSWRRVGDTLLFASETSAILDLPFVEPDIKELNVAKVLAHVPRGAEETFFESVFYLPSAHCLKASPGRQVIRKYWDIDPDHRVEYEAETGYAEHFLDLVDQAVRCRMRSIRPVAVALSGGHDSSLLAACAERVRANDGMEQERIRSISYIFDRHPEADERNYIQMVADHCGLQAEYLNADELWTFKELETQPVPRDYLWTNCYSQLPASIARAAGAARIGVLVDGQFGDALCSGQSMVAAQLLQQARFAELFSLLHSGHSDSGWREELIERGIRPLLPSWLRRAWRALFPARLEPFVGGMDGHWIRRVQAESSEARESGVMNELGPARRQRYGYLMNASWSHGFAAARGHVYNRYGVERVSPYFDRRIVEFVMAVPVEQLACPGKYRRLQTNAMKRVLPPKVCERRTKASFDGLLREGLLVQERDVVRQLLENSETVRQGWVSREWLEQQYDAGEDWDMAGYPFSMCLHLELWLKAVAEAGARKAKWAVPYRYRPRNDRGR